MFARWVRSWNGSCLRPLLAALTRGGARAVHLTLAGLCAAVGAGLALGLGAMATAMVLVWLAGAFDGLDGALARHQGRASPLGAFIDSMCDHLGDCAIHLGLVRLALAGDAPGRPLLVTLIVLSLFGSVFGSQVRSRAAALGLELKDVGLFTRGERIVVLGLGLLAHQIAVAVAALALLNNVSAAQRLVHALGAARASRRPVAAGVRSTQGAP
jgi:CDP-diacylglycerol--glycerol-3-phosphate 3-phosphatidyltransferase